MKNSSDNLIFYNAPEPGTHPKVILRKMPQVQEDLVDCGLFTIAYATDLAFGNDPSKIIYDQASMRHHLLRCLEQKQIAVFPRHRVLHVGGGKTDVTVSNDPVQIWQTPKQLIRQPPVTTAASIPLSNSFAPLQLTFLFLISLVNHLLPDKYPRKLPIQLRFGTTLPQESQMSSISPNVHYPSSR